MNLGEYYAKTSRDVGMVLSVKYNCTEKTIGGKV